ncbi:MAG: phage tail sheath family protein [Leptothrix sp. (in: b-proteobacteria)]
MSVALTFPGVYIQEAESAVRTIVGVATSIAAFVGRAQRGPTDLPVVINSYADFERTFGGLWTGSELGFSVRAFYLNGGGQAVIVRLFSEQALAKAAAEAVAAAVVMESAAAGATPQSVAKAGVDAVPVSPASVASAAAAAKVVADAGTHAAAQAAATIKDVVDSVNAAVEPATSAAAGVAGVGRAQIQISAEQRGASKAANAVVAAVTKQSTLSGATPQSVAKAGADAVAATGASSASATAAAKAVAGAGTNAAAPGGAKIKDVVDAVSAAVTAAIAGAIAPVGAGGAQVKADTLTLQASSPGAWGNQLRVRIDAKVDPSLAGKAFNLIVRDMGTGQVEVFRNVSVGEGARQIDKVLSNQSRLVGITGALPKSPPAPHDDPQPGEDIWKLDNLSTAAQTAGDDGGPLTANDFIGAGKDVSKSGLYALRKADLFNLLVIPPYLDGGDIDAALVSPTLQFCSERRAIFLLDGPSDWSTKEAAKTGIAAFQGDANNKNAALFFPRLFQANPIHENQLETFAAAGAIAGVFARTDANRGVWKAPAGLDASLNGVPALAVGLTDGEVGELNPLGINCLRATPASGRVVWGSRTLDGADQLTSQWKYLPVRRTALFIEESLYRATQWIVFEPNDEPLWSQIRLNIGAFMHDLFRKGAFQGTTPKDAYFVKCDKDTTTQSDINLGIVNIIVGFAPLKPAEFVVITLQQIAGQIDV